MTVTYIGTDVSKDVTIKSVKRLRDGRQVVNLLMRDLRSPYIEYLYIKRLGALRASIINQNSISFAVTEDKLMNFGLEIDTEKYMATSTTEG